MVPNLPPKSPRMTSPQLHRDHPVIPITEPQQEISIDEHEEKGREVGGIVYHPLGKGKSSPTKEGNRFDGGEREEARRKADRFYQSPGQAGGGVDRGRVEDRSRAEGHEDHGLNLQRQPHRDTQETGPSLLPLLPAMTAQHLPSATHHHSPQHPSHRGESDGGPRLSIQPPTPEISSPPALQVRSLNTTPNNHTGQEIVNSMNEDPQSKSRGEGQGGINQQGGGIGEGIMSRFKTTFLSKNKGPMSKTWARKSYLDELENMAPTSPPATSPREYRSAPILPLDHGGHGDLESGQGIRRIT